MTDLRMRRWAGFARVVGFVVLAAALSGCVIVPYEPFRHYHHW